MQNRIIYMENNYSTFLPHTASENTRIVVAAMKITVCHSPSMGQVF